MTISWLTAVDNAGGFVCSMNQHLGLRLSRSLSRTEAQAEAEAIQKIAAAVADTKADPTQYLIAVKYIETIEEVLKEGGAGSKTVFMPYEASGLMSSVGGLKELMNATSD